MISTTQPQDPCPCGSGDTYADCHKDIVEAAPEEMLNIARKIYARRWTGNSTFYESQNLYSTLANHLSQHVTLSRVIDIGCGRGQGMAALRSRMHGSDSLLIGVDENPFCLAAAAEHLKIAPANERLERQGGQDREYDLIVKAGLLPEKDKIVLIQSDLMRPDEELDDFVLSGGKLDAVTLWFNGIHAARQFDVALTKSNFSSDREVRMVAELDAAEYAAHMVRSKGVFHLVGRGRSRNERTMRETVLPDMEEIADDHLSLSNLTIYPYQEPMSGERIAVGQQGSNLTDGKTFAYSAIFVVP